MIKHCKNKCCKLVVSEYVESGEKIIDNIRRFKAGIILHNIPEDKILIVQSRGNLWGFPKGSFEEGENFKMCAIRELKEETGIKIEESKLNKFYKINNYVMYFYVEYNKIEKLEIQKSKNNDANGIGWIKVECLQEDNDENLSLNYHAKRCLQKFFKIVFN
tara:strand:+ start:1116 stop:1598 length:483 start_codon:yes stop_codon:yes gene_type:complete